VFGFENLWLYDFGYLIGTFSYEDDLYFVPAVIGIIVAIVVVGAVLLLMLRKRP
jgi:hypothetical protein